MQEGQNVYLEVFHKELEAFKQRVKEYIAKCRSDISNTEQQNTGTNYRLDSKETTDLLPQVSAAGDLWPVEMIDVTTEQSCFSFNYNATKI